MTLKQKAIVGTAVILIILCLLGTTGWLLNGFGITQFDMSFIVSFLNVLNAIIGTFFGTGGLF